MNGVEEKIVALIADLDHPEKPKIRAAVDALIDLSADAPGLKAALEQRLNDEQQSLGGCPRTRPFAPTFQRCHSGITR